MEITVTDALARVLDGRGRIAPNAFTACELRFIASLLDLVGSRGIDADTMEALVRPTRRNHERN